MKWVFVAVLTIFFFSVVATQIRETQAATTRNFTLYGSASQGWNTTSPGPTIKVEQGDTVNLTLISSDGNPHLFFVSYTNATSPGSSDPQSSSFTGTTYFSFTAANTVGTYTYRCAIHPTVMYGSFQVVPTGSIPEFQPLIMLSLLIASTALVTLACKRKK